MLAAPRSPLRTPASCAASLRARYSPPRLTCCRRSALPGSPLAVLQPPPHLCGKVAVLHPRLTRRLPTPRAPRRSPHSRPHAHKSAAKWGDGRGEGRRLIKVRKGNCPHIRPSLPPLVRSSTLPLQSHRSRVEWRDGGLGHFTSFDQTARRGGKGALIRRRGMGGTLVHDSYRGNDDVGVARQ